MGKKNSSPLNFFFILSFFLLSFVSFSFGQRSYGTVMVTGSKFPQDISFVKWLSPDYTWLYVSSGYLYRSWDSGKEFKLIELPNQPVPRAKSSNNEGPVNIVKSIIETTKREQHYALGTNHMLWRTKDGAVWEQILSNKTVHHVIPHPIESTWVMFIVQDINCTRACRDQLYVSKDMGDNLKLLSKSVLPGEKPQATWGAAGKDKITKENIHFVGVPEEKQGDDWIREEDYAYFHSDDLFKTIKKKWEKCIGMLYKPEGYLFIATQESSFASGELFVSEDDGLTFNQVRFPKDRDHYRYNILDLSEGAVFINVAFGDHQWGNLYVSDSGTGSLFSESLKYNTRSQLKVDFLKIEGVDGFYLANAYDVGKGEEPTDLDPVKTFHSSDNGGSWRTLKPPPKEDCSSAFSTACTLNLYGGTSSMFSNYYSSKFATGLVMATGRVGPSLIEAGTDKLKTYFSRDAGFTWTSVKNSTYHYTFADQGSIVVLADNQRSTKVIHYSLNQGLSWVDVNLEAGEYELDSVETPPTGINKKVVVYGVDRNTHEGHLFLLDFGSLNVLECVDSDYEDWSPHYDSDTGQDRCILGQKLTYRRRKRDSICFHDVLYSMTLVAASCPCVAEDYECDYCFVQVGDKCYRSYEGECIFYNHEAAPIDCKGSYTVSQGYRKVAKTKCSDTHERAIANRRRIDKKCPGPADKGNSRAKALGLSIGLTVALLLAIGVFVYLVKTKPAVRDWYHGKIDWLWNKYLSFRDRHFDGTGRVDRRSGSYSALASPGRSSGLDVNDNDDLIDDN